jgi:Holliday junction resolvase RusA-like endonuclease
MTSLAFTVVGAPRGKGRPRTAVRGGFATIYTDSATKGYEALVRAAALDALDGDGPMQGPLSVTMRFRLEPPKSTSRKLREEMLSGRIWPTKKPDLDNAIKAILDGCNHTAFQDDAQVVRLECCKIYADTAGVDVAIRRAA